MALQATNPTPAHPNAAATAAGSATAITAPGLPTAALENLAARFRPAGLFLACLRPDGSVAYHDAAAPAFFLRYLLPQLQAPDAPGADPALRDKLRLTTAASGISPWSMIPGVEIAACPHVEKRHLAGIVLLAAKSDAFASSEDVLRVCSRLGLDAAWLEAQADHLPPHDTRALGREARLLLTMIRDQVRLGGLEQELTSLSGQLANSYEELSLIYQISSGMKVNRRAADFFKQTCLDLMEVLGVRGMGVALCGDKAGLVEPALYGQIAFPHQRLRQISGEVLRVLRDRKAPLLVNDLARDKNLRPLLGDDARRLIAVPLQRQDEVHGCLFGLDKLDGEFDSVDAKLLNSIANESAIYLENARLFEDVHGLMMGLLHALTSAVDAKDAYTCGHSERVALISRALAQRAGLTDHQVQRIYMAGLLHDVGKIGVPEAVLQKAGKLTDEEFDLIKKHPEIGARILRDVKQVQDIIPGVLYHHERYDGRGYPAKLAGEDIPLMGRIICLADCFDAMTSSRTYRKALPLETALEEIRRNAGTQFDPRLAETFLSIGVERLTAILNDHQTRSLPPIMVTANHIPAAAPLAAAAVAGPAPEPTSHAA